MSSRRTQSLGFNGSAVDTLAVTSPFWAASRPSSGGISFGDNMDTQEPWDYHPFQWNDEDRIPNLIQMDVAKIGSGKTTLIDTVAARYSAMKIGVAKEETEEVTYREMRVWADQIRKLHGMGELARLADFFDSEVVDANRRINPLDPALHLDLDEQMETVIEMMTLANNSAPLERHIPYAVQVAMDRMYSRYKNDASLDTLGDLLRVQDASFETDYHVKATLAERNGKEPSAELLKDLSRESNLVEAEWRQDSFRAYELLARVIGGDFGRRFGGTESMAEKLKQRAVIMDLSDTPDAAIMLIQSLNWRVRKSANKRQDLDFMYQIDIHDENWKMWNYLTYANAMYEYLKHIRSYETLVLINTHRPNDYTTVGTEGSPQREKATKMLSDVGMWFVGRQEAADANEIAHLIGLNGVEEKRLLTLQKGQWCIKLGTERPVWVDTTSMFNKTIQDLSFSNQALRQLLARGQEIDTFLEEAEKEFVTQ